MNTTETLIDTAERKVAVLKATGEFVAALNTKHAEYQEVFEISGMGKRYIKIAQYSAMYLKPGQAPSRSVHAFVDVLTGDLLKAAGWNAPAKGARGNILDETQREGIVARADRFGGYLYIR